MHLFVLATLSASTLSVSGCGEDLSDSAFGGVDLVPFFLDTATGLPESIGAQAGWHDGQRAFNYLFGRVAVEMGKASPRQIEDLGIFGVNGGTTVPTAAHVNPMYFFFDADGNPMFSRPIREKKTGNFTLRGGKALRNPNPRADASRLVAYPIRSRALLNDPNRNSADYQRPIIDQIYDDIRIVTDRRNHRYTGLWEFVKVTPPSGYEPDQIKSWRTLEKGWNNGNGEFAIDRTGLVLNCPLVDSRTLVVPSVAAYPPQDENDPATFPTRIPQPLVEVWYRKKMINCFLVNGWETLGRTLKDPEGRGDDTYELFGFHEDDRRIGTLDSDTFIVGEGRAEERLTVSPIGRVYIPTIYEQDATGPAWAGNQYASTANVVCPRDGGTSPNCYADFIMNHMVFTGALPRRSKSDPRGYRPIRWFWTIDILNLDEVGLKYDKAGITGENNNAVPLNDIANIDSSRMGFPRVRRTAVDSNGVPTSHIEPLVGNIAMAGMDVSCEAVVQAVSKFQDPPPDPCPSMGLVCPIYQETAGNFCEVKKVRYGEYCAATVAKCFDRVDRPRFDDGNRQHVVHHGDVIESWFFEGTVPPPMCPDADPACIDQPLLDELTSAVPPDWLHDRKDLLSINFGFVNLPNGEVYRCLTDNRRLGHCYIACEGGEGNLLQGEFVSETIDTTTGPRTVRLPLDSRCGGRRMPGFRCMPVTDELRGTGGRVCLRDCDGTLPQHHADATCNIPTPIYISDHLNPIQNGQPNPYDIAAGTKCLSIDPPETASFDSCIKDVAFEPL